MLEIGAFTRDFLDFSYTWLCDSEIKTLTMSNVFSNEDQITWFESLPNKKDYLIFGMKYDSIPIGVCGLKNITDSDCEFWGYIGEKEYWGKGLGKQMLSSMIKEASDRDIKTVILKVLKTNQRAINLYANFGFSIIKTGDNIYLMSITL